MSREYGRGTAAMLRMLLSTVSRRTGVAAVLAVAVLAAVLSTTEGASADTNGSRAVTDTDASIRRAFAQAALEVGEAYHVTHRYFEPSLNGIAVDHVPSVPVSDQGSVSRLVARATRRSLLPGVAMHSHLAAVLRDEVGCVDQGTPTWLWDCGDTYRFRLPSIGGARHGALELEAGMRSAGTPIGPFALLSAAFETAQWRPAGVHPMLAESARQLAAQMRLRTRELDVPCHVTALWVLAAVVAEVPDMHLIGDLLLHRSDRFVDLSSLVRHAARRGCTAAAAFAEASGSPPDMLAFWEPATALRISARAGGGSARALGVLTNGELREDAPSLVDAWPSEVGAADGAFAHAAAPHRACDAVKTVQPHSAMTRVRGFAVHPCLATDLRSLLAAAQADGISLGGYGWRSTASTISLRQKYCPLPSRSSAGYWLALSLLPSGYCQPPVAPPTRSRHEYGLAVDFECGPQRASITRRSPCYRWLAANAHRFGLYNFAAEPWHWSTDGR